MTVDLNIIDFVSFPHMIWPDGSDFKRKCKTETSLVNKHQDSHYVEVGRDWKINMWGFWTFHKF